MKTMFMLALLSRSAIAGCSQADLHPDKWHLTGYENGKLLIRHDHKLYTAKCFQSVSAGQKDPDSTPQCSDMLVVPGIGQEIPEKRDGQVRWLSAGTYAIYTPAEDGGPQLQFSFVSIKEDAQ
jgi:hypothetical protein